MRFLSCLQIFVSHPRAKWPHARYVQPQPMPEVFPNFGVRVQRSYRLLLGTTWGHGAGLVDWWIGGLVDGEMGGWGDGWIAAYCRKGAFRFMVRNADFEQPQKPGPAHFFHLDLP